MRGERRSCGEGCGILKAGSNWIGWDERKGKDIPDGVGVVG